MIDNFLGVPVAKIGGFPYGEWRTEPPTEPGSFWVIVDGRIFENPVWVKSDPPYIDWPGCEWTPPFFFENVTHWLGPLPVPEMPK